VDDSFDVSKRPVTITSMTPPKGVTPYLDFIKMMMESHSDTDGHH
jgi:succinate dehydrogenase / fumarate reductase flavoprotein subunit